MKHHHLWALGLAVVLAGCASAFDPTGRSPREIYEHAVAAFTEGDLYEAQRLFDIIRLQYPASEYAPDAQFYLAEISYKRQEYVVASFNYSMMRRQYPTHPRAKEALYKAALCYVQLAPPFDRDQDYTRKAITALQEFIRTYPNDSLASEAQRQIRRLRNELARREYSIAEQYRILQSPQSALIYYDAVIEDYGDTDYIEYAFVGKVEVLLELRRYDEALSVCVLYRQLFPRGSLRERIEELQQQIPANGQRAGFKP
ncbi:MAG: outer membrane protein assembly factor BamD [Bacteroidota bacterium]|nr:outer membrane protein assembly factor BamD [Candidatus Kapabacteria bacterium]MDW8075346.1 outer membrane protein assembly factor BamD [Bacteroidota bacterium]